MSSVNLKSGRLNVWLASLVLGSLGAGCNAMASDTTFNDPSDSPPRLAGDAAAPAEVAAVSPVRDRSYADVESAIRGIQQAPTPDDALAAYSAGVALDRDNISLQEAFIRRQVDLNSPQLAEPAARRLVGISPGSSLAWAVIAFSEAKRGNMVDALTDIAVAGRRLPDDPFVQRTAGEMLAWYDNAPSRPALGQGIAADLDSIHRSLASASTFSEAYSKANAFYKNPPRPSPAAQSEAGGAASASPANAPVAGSNPAPDSDRLSPAPDAVASPGADLSASAPVYSSTVTSVPLAAPAYSYSDVYYSPAVVASYGPSYFAPSCNYYYSGCDVGFGFGFSLPLLYIGGDWGWCGGGGWQRHWDGWGGGYGRGYGYGRNSGGFAAGYGNYSRNRNGFSGGNGASGRNLSGGIGLGAQRAAPAYTRGSGSLANRSSGVMRSGAYAASPRYSAPSGSIRSAGRQFSSPSARYAPSRGASSDSRSSYRSSAGSSPHFSSSTAGRSGGSYPGGGHSRGSAGGDRSAGGPGQAGAAHGGGGGHR